MHHRWLLLYPTDKASIMHAIERVTGEKVVTVQTTDIAQADPLRVLIVDAMAVLQSMKKHLSCKLLLTFKKPFSSALME